MKNIAVLVQFLYAGGAERIAGLLSKYLSTRYNVYVFTKDTERIVYTYGGQLVDICENGEQNIEETIREKKIKYNIDCSISFLEPMNFVNVKSKGHDTVILSERQAIGGMKPYPIGESVKIKKWYNFADKIVCCAYGVEYDLAYNFEVKKELLTTVYNFIDQDAIVRKAQQCISQDILDFVGDSEVILHVGRFDPQKNHVKLLYQFKKVLDRGFDVKLIMIGSGVLENKIIQLADELGISKQVYLINYNSNPFPIYKIAKLMIQSSEYEGLPNVLLESMVLQIPIVAVDCLSGPRELLIHNIDYSTGIDHFVCGDKGILVEKLDSDTLGETSYLADGICYMLTHPDYYKDIKEKQRQYMMTYKNEDIGNRWVEIIESTARRDVDVPKIDFSSMKQYSNIIVFGAGAYGKNTMSYLLKEKMNGKLYFAVGNKESNLGSVWGIEVHSIYELQKIKDDSIVVLGVSYTFEREVIALLNELGFTYYLPEV